MRSLIVSSALAAGVVLLSAPTVLAQQNAAFCLRGSDSGALDCSFNTMAQCQETMKGASNTGMCIPNPSRPGTTGSGAAAPATPGSSPATPPARPQAAPPQ